jgi:hypothetical protein
VYLSKIKKDEQKSIKVETASHLNFTIGLIAMGILAETFS